MKKSIRNILLFAIVALGGGFLGMAVDRLLSGSVWTAWLLHSLANAISMPLISEGFVALPDGLAGTLLTPGAQGLVQSLLMGLIGLGLCLYQKQHSQ